MYNDLVQQYKLVNADNVFDEWPQPKYGNLLDIENKKIVWLYKHQFVLKVFEGMTKVENEREIARNECEIVSC